MEEMSLWDVALVGTNGITVCNGLAQRSDDGIYLDLSIVFLIEATPDGISLLEMHNLVLVWWYHGFECDN